MFPNDPNCWEIDDEYFYGPDILVAPILEAGMRERKVYLPEGADWIYELDGKKYSGGQDVTVSAPLDCIPTFHRV